jgi:hypothetical protein
MTQQDTFLTKLENLRARTRSGHEAILQVKVPATLREEFYKALEQDSLTVKDIVLSAIEAYLQSRR